MSHVYTLLATKQQGPHQVFWYVFVEHSIGLHLCYISQLYYLFGMVVIMQYRFNLSNDYQ